MRARASIFSANKYFQIKVLNPYRVFVDRYERDSVVVGIVGMCIDDRQQDAAHQTYDDSIAYAPLCFKDFILPKTDADKGTAAVTDHDRNSQCHNRKREHNRVGSVAVRTEIAGVGNKDLVYDIIQRADQQRNNARDRVFLHQLADAFRAEELIGTFHGIHLYLSILGQKNNGQPSCNRFYA